MTRGKKVGGLIALQRKRKKERLKLAVGQQTAGSFGAEHMHGVDRERMFAAGEDNLKFASDFLDIDKVERRLRELSGLILSYVSAVGNLKMPMWQLQCIQQPEQWDWCPLVQVLHDLLQVQPGYSIEKTMLSLPHEESDNPTLITAIIVFLLKEFVFQKDSPFETTSVKKISQGFVRSEEALKKILQESRLELLTEKASNFGTLCSLHREEFATRLSQVMEPIVGVNPTTVHYHKRIEVLGDELKTGILAYSGTYEAVTAPIRGTFDPHLHKADTLMRAEQNLKGLPIFLTTMIGVKCRRPGGDWKICVHAQVRLWPRVVPCKVEPNLVEERQTKRCKTEGATKTRSTPQTLERDPKPLQTKRRSPSPIPWTDLNPDWSKEWRSSIIYPPTGEKRATVDKEDVGRLNEGEFLNDNLIVFYLRWLQCQLEKEKPATAKRIFFHNSFFYSKLTSPEEGMKGLNYAAVERWTKDDLLHHDYIIVPVNERMHWYVAIICNAPKLLGAEVKGQSRSQNDTEVPEHHEMKANNVPQSTPQKSSQTKRKSLPAPRKQDPKGFRIITLDSLKGGHSSTCTNLKDYLVLEARAKLDIDIPRPGAIGTTAKGIPLQDNYCDCGVFLLNYVEMFLKDPDTFISHILQNQVGGDMEWPKAPETRIRIRELLFSLQKEQSSEMPDSSEVVEVIGARQTAESQLRCGGKKRSSAASAISHLSSPVPDDVNFSVQILLKRDTNDLRSHSPEEEYSNVDSAEDYRDGSEERVAASESPISVNSFRIPPSVEQWNQKAEIFLDTHWKDYMAPGAQLLFDEFKLNYPGDRRTVDLVVDLFKLRELGITHGFYHYFQSIQDLSAYLGPPQRRVDANNFVGTMLEERHKMLSGNANPGFLRELRIDTELFCGPPIENMLWSPNEIIGVSKLRRHPHPPLKVSWRLEGAKEILLYGYIFDGGMEE